MRKNALITRFVYVYYKVKIRFVIGMMKRLNISRMFVFTVSVIKHEFIYTISEYCLLDDESNRQIFSVIKFN